MATDRDRSIESLLRRREIETPQSTDQCVDAESLAAWMEGGLTASARAAAEQHAAGCVRCQALLASMARTEVDVPLTPWWRSLTAKWLVPIAAVATALVVWISVGQQYRAVPAPQPSSTAASPPANIAEPAPAAPSSAPAVPPRASADALEDRRARQLKQTEKPDAERRQELDKLERRRADDRRATVEQSKPPVAADAVAGGIAAPPRPQGQTTDSAFRSASPSQPSAAPVPAPGPPLSGLQAPAAPPPPTATPAPADARGTAAGGLAESVSVRQEAAKELAAARGGAGGGGGRAESAINGIEIRSPDPTYRWSIRPPAGILRSTDGGTTWASVDPVAATLATRANTGAPPVLIAGSSPSRDVCWIVGRAGVVLLSTNGATWQRRPFPETADLTSVRASSATSAVVMTADGRQFVTIDGGATWSAVK